MSSHEAEYQDSVARMTDAVRALPARRREEAFQVLAAYMDTFTAAVESPKTRRQSGDVSPCRPVATPSGGGGYEAVTSRNHPHAGGDEATPRQHDRRTHHG